jgi:hypothetical protein
MQEYACTLLALFDNLAYLAQKLITLNLHHCPPISSSLLRNLHIYFEEKNSVQHSYRCKK